LKTEEGPIVLDAILSELPQDDNWGDTPIERGYAKAGLKRYQIQHELLSKFTKTSGREDNIASRGEKTGKETNLDIEDTAPVKLEHPRYQELVNKAGVIRSAEKKAAQAVATLKREKASAAARVGEVAGALGSH
jgi:hypothetical protein